MSMSNVFFLYFPFLVKTEVISASVVSSLCCLSRSSPRLTPHSSGLDRLAL
jgi:hypothetical protein